LWLLTISWYDAPKGAAMFELTPEQRRELGQTEPARALDPETKVEYVLVRADLYERMKAILEEGGLEMRQVAALVEQAMREDDANDPLLESYDKYRTSS
jgi:hypothetical protein